MQTFTIYADTPFYWVVEIHHDGYRQQIFFIRKQEPALFDTLLETLIARGYQERACLV